MFEYLNSNPFIVLVIGVLVIFVLMFSFTKGAKSKKKKDDAKQKEEKHEENKTSEQKSKDEEVVVDAKKKKKLRKAKNKPQIEFVYKKTEQSKKEEKIEDDTSKIDSELNERAQFVKTTNKISKFIGLSDINDIQLKNEQEVFEIKDEQVFHEDCNDSKCKHFDRTRRLSKMVKEDSFDDMLQAHISEKYMNIHSEKHLRFDDDFSSKLFARANNTIDNGSCKIMVDEEGNVESREKMSNDKNYMRTWLQQQSASRIYEQNEPSEDVPTVIVPKKNDLDLSAKNIMVVDALLHRKGKDKRVR